MRRWLLVVAVPLVVLVSTAIVCVLLAASEREDSDQRRVAQAKVAATRVDERVATTVSRLSTISGLFAASTEVTESEFRAFTRTLVAEPTIDNIIYVARVPAGKRAAFERRIGVPIVDGGGPSARPSPARREYFPYAMVGKAPDTARVSTPDAASERLRARALRLARDTGSAHTTAPVRTFRTRIPSLLVFVPLYRGALPPLTVAERRRTLRGFAVGVLPLTGVVPSAEVGSVALLDRGRRIAGARGLGDATTVPFTLAGRRFEVRAATGIPTDYTLVVALAIGGWSLAATLAIILVILFRREAYAQRLVRLRLAERREIEHALADSERRYRLLAENASDWITLIDANGVCTYSSPSGRTVLGREPSEIVGGTFTDLVHPDDVPEAIEIMKTIGRGGSPASVELRQQHADGHWVPLEISLAVVRAPDTGAVREVRCALRDVTERHELEEKLRKLAVEDTLTGLPNRRGLAERMEAELALSRRYGGGALLMIDLDDFKQVNDTLGHACGDEVLCRVADVLRESTRESDHVTRLGGDEFAVLLPRVDDAGAAAAATKIIDALREDPELQRLFGHPLTASVGIASMTGTPDLGSGELLLAADRALYAAKAAGRDQVAAAGSASFT